jgi:transmembrane sensor
MAERTEDISEIAIEWLIKLRDGTGEDWERFVEWLEADPAHSQAFDEAMAADGLADGLPRSVPRPLHRPSEAPAPSRPARRAFLGWGAAGVLVASLGYWSLRPDRQLYAIETAPGEQRSINLADGSRVDLNGGTRLDLDRNNARFAQLAKGEAFFKIARNPAHPFRVDAGNAEVRVLGTAFNVVRTTSTIEVAVAEGAILFDGAQERVRVNAGTVLRGAEGRITLAKTSWRDVGSWREARLSYSSAPIARIAADISRTAGVRIEASPEVANRRFSGVIIVERDHERLMRRVAALLDVGVRRSGDAWVLTSERAQH